MPSSPGWAQGYIPSSTEWNNEFAAKADAAPAVPINQGGTGQQTAPLGNYALQQRGLIASSPATLALLTTNGIRTALSPFTLDLPALSSALPGDWIIVYDISYNAGANPITIAPAGADQIAYYGSLHSSLPLNVSGAWVMLSVDSTCWSALIRTA